MKKAVFAAVVAVAALCAVSCKNTDKCSCSYDLKKITYKDQIVKRPEDKKCSEISASDIKIFGLSVDASNYANISCKNYEE